MSSEIICLNGDYLLTETYFSVTSRRNLGVVFGFLFGIEWGYAMHDLAWT